MKRTHSRAFLLLLFAAGACLGAAPVIPKDSTEAKIRLMSEALHARDLGDIPRARACLQELLELSPGDETVLRLIAGLSGTPARKVTVSGAVEVTSAEEAEADALLREAAESQDRPRAAALPAAAAPASPPVTGPALVDAPRLPTEFETPPAENQRAQTRDHMLAEVDEAWRRPIAAAVAAGEEAREALSPMEDKLARIVLPEVNFSGMALGRVVNTLSAISAEFDQTGREPKGVNIVLFDPVGADPSVSLTLRNLPLRRVLDFVTAAVGYQYEVQADAVVVRVAGDQAALETRFFPVSRATVLRMTGRPVVAAAEPAGPGTVENEGQAIRTFLQLAGVDFEGVPGSTLAFDGSQLIVTQSPRNLGRVRNILIRYREVRQVEIEAKFMEVQEGALEELGVQWKLANKATQLNAADAIYTTGDGITRSLADAFRNATTSQRISITGEGQPEGGFELPTAAPTIPGGVLTGNGAAPLADVSGVIGEFDVNAVVRALSQKSGTELLSAPRLTVLSGNPATITIAQELRYPQSYGQIQSQVGTGSISGGGSAGVSITSGTPQEFTTRNVGVELRVTPTVEEDDRSISLDLNPKVTEFEGFVEYGGPSVAISGGTTVTVPPGFYQPIFAVRELTTRVTLWDGATLVMGGLTREDVKKVHDKVPVLGSIPVIGRLFRSEGESTQKRNLLIFVTANLVNPGGTLRRRIVADPQVQPGGEDR